MPVVISGGWRVCNHCGSNACARNPAGRCFVRRIEVLENARDEAREALRRVVRENTPERWVEAVALLRDWEQTEGEQT